jgi:putative copper export protein
MLEALAALAKAILYTGVLLGAGSALVAASLGPRLNGLQSASATVARWGGAAAAVASLAVFALLISRLGGFDPTIISTVLETPSALAAGLQFAGGALLIFSSVTSRSRLLSLIGAVLAIASFGINGHAPSLGLVEGVIAFLHVSAASWWAASLPLLAYACKRQNQTDLVALVRRFSGIAMTIVGGLVIAGAAIVLSLVDFSRQPWLSPYGQLLTLKIAFAGSALGLAAFNKFRLTPRLAAGHPAASSALLRSIQLEIGFILAVLITTAILTTYSSPHA